MRPGDRIYEIKFDGYRALALRGGRLLALKSHRASVAFVAQIEVEAMQTEWKREAEAPIKLYVEIQNGKRQFNQRGALERSSALY